MKKSLTLIALLISLCCNAQTIETKSSCDSNADGQVTVADVTNTANKVIGKAVTEKQVVTAEDLNSVLQSINEKLEKLSALESRLNSLEAINNAMAENMGLPYNNGHEYVDLGLPSGLKWATMNVGATEIAGSKINQHTGRLDCYGEYYAWGETSPKDTYDWSNLKYCTSYDQTYYKFTFSKYVISSESGTVDNKNTLELSDDAARANWGGSWRMPTYAEFEELRNNCYWEWTTNYNNSGVKGYIIYKVKDASDKGKYPYYDYVASNYITPTTFASYSLSDAHIFLPAAGTKNQDSGYYACYWSSMLGQFNSDGSYILMCGSGTVHFNSYYRFCGSTIRPVCP